MITREWPLLACYGTAALFLVFDQTLLGNLGNTARLATVFGSGAPTSCKARCTCCCSAPTWS